MNARSRGWCYTLNNYDEVIKEHLKTLECKYHVFGEEKGEEKDTPHLQGYIYWVNAKKMSQVLKLFKDWHPHLETQRGSAEEAATYCKKDGAFFEQGEMPAERGGGGGEKEKERWKLALEAAKSGRIDEIPPDIFLRHYNVIKAIRRDYDITRPVLPDIVLKDWQTDLLNNLNGAPDERIIHIIIDPKGGAGKSTFCRWLINNLEGVEIFGSGASKDIALAIKKPKIALFDFARCVSEARPWNIVEQVKNGMVFNSKYESGMKYFPIPHVVVFTNQPVEPGKLSDDRMNNVYLSQLSASSDIFIRYFLLLCLP